MSRTKNWIARACVFGAVMTAGALGFASVQDASIVIDHALNSPTLTIRYSGAHVAMVELRLNGVSYATRNVDAAQAKGETNFTLDATSLTNGDNDVDVRLYDKTGKLVGTEHSTVLSDDGKKAPVYLEMPKTGATVQGPVQISLGFGKDLKNIYIDNQFKSMTNTPPFEFVWDTSHDSNGWHDLEAWVVDDSSNTLKTRKVKVFVNNPGGLTVRQFTPAATIPAPAIPKVAAPPAPKTLSLVTSVSTPTAAVHTVSAAAKATSSTVTAAANATHAIAPTVSAHTAPTKVAVAAAPMSNTVKATIGSAAGVKAESLDGAVSSGPRLLLPTGKRVAGDQPALTGAIGAKPVAKTDGHVAPLPKVTPVVVTKPATTVKPAAKPAEAAQPGSEVSVTVAKSAVQPTTPPQKAATASVAKATAAAKETRMIAVGHGTKLAASGAYSISLNAKPVQFDSVKPRVENNVPLTPFRYLFEQSGGKVQWTNETKSVSAAGQGKEIYIKIGDKLAKVNNLPVQLDLTPFIENGRTIVPLSFIKDALDVEVDYDPVTNHVLITSIKKKH